MGNVLTARVGKVLDIYTPVTFGATIGVWAPEALHPVHTIPVMITIAAMAD